MNNKFLENEFIIYVNAYYQAHAIYLAASKIITYNNDKIPYELQIFRSIIQNNSSFLYDLIIKGDDAINNIEFEKELIKGKLKVIYRVSDSFITEMENSIKIGIDNSNSMDIYWISFNQGAKNLYYFVNAVIRNINSSITINEAVDDTIDSILFENFWEGDELINRINLIRALSKELNYSTNWIKEFSIKMIMNIDYKIFQNQ